MNLDVGSAAFDRELVQCVEHGHHEQAMRMLFFVVERHIGATGRPRRPTLRALSIMAGYAARRGLTSVYKLILSKSRSSVDIACNTVNDAAKNGHVEIVKIAMASGGESSVDASIVMAAERGHVETVMVLLGACLAPHEKRRAAKNALFVAAEHGETDVLKAVLGMETFDRQAIEDACAKAYGELAWRSREPGAQTSKARDACLLLAKHRAVLFRKDLSILVAVMDPEELKETLCKVVDELVTETIMDD